MKITIEMVDGFVMSMANGKTTNARVARVRWQAGPRKPYEVANIIVDEVSPSRVVEAVAMYLKEKEAKAR